MIERAEQVAAKLKQLEATSRQKNNVSVIVGYTARYALWVHEAPMKLKGLPRKRPHKGFYWDPQGRAQNKYLEQPFRDNIEEIKRLILVNAQATGSLEAGLLTAGLYLQRLSMQLVPVDTGNLKASAFTRKEPL